MKRHRAAKSKFDLIKILNIVFFSMMMLSCLLNSANTRAAIRAQPDYHLAVANHKFDGITQFETLYRLRPPRRFRASYSEFVIGVFSSSEESSVFVSIGLFWRTSNSEHSFFSNFDSAQHSSAVRRSTAATWAGIFTFFHQPPLALSSGNTTPCRCRCDFSICRTAALAAQIRE